MVLSPNEVVYMGRLDQVNNQIEEENAVVVASELERLDGRPDTIPQHVWDLIRENGELATTRLNELLRSPRFSRYKVADQAKLIALAQDRAYGKPSAPKQTGGRRKGGSRDVVNTELDNMAYRTTLPEYRKVGVNDNDNSR